MKYRKKPVVVDAWRWTFSRKDDEPPTWVTDALGTWPAVGGIAFEPDGAAGTRMVLAMLESTVVVPPGSWIVRSVSGEIYPVHADIFEATYERVEDPATPAGRGIDGDQE